MESAAWCVTGLSLRLWSLFISIMWRWPSSVLLTIIYLSCRGNSSAAGDWVNCGVCGEWAHFGCDRRQGLGAFKVLLNFDLSECLVNLCLISKSPSKRENFLLIFWTLHNLKHADWCRLVFYVMWLFLLFLWVGY